MSTAPRTPAKRRAAALARRAVQSRPGRKLIDAVRGEWLEPETPVADDLDVDSWLTAYFGEELGRIDRACAGAGPEAYALFRDLDEDVWALLLSRQYSSYPNILALLPETPEPVLQRRWNGACGLTLLRETKAFYSHVGATVAAHGAKPLADSRVLDYGLGWGRIARFFARDVEPGSLFGVDPAPEILDVCRTSRLPAELAQIDFLPETLPFGEIDLAYSFSVFTHISENAARTCLQALHTSMAPGGLLVMTIRPPGFIERTPKMSAVAEQLGDPVAAMREPRFVFVPDHADGHPQYGGGEMTYGESAVSIPYVRERWGDLFEIVDVKAAIEDIYQVALVLKRR